MANYDSNTVSVIDTDTSTAVKTVGAGSEPDAVAIAPDGSLRLRGQLRLKYGEHHQHLDQHGCEDREGRYRPEGIAITPDRSYAYVANYAQIR